jgi:hypothetical protein
MESGSRDVGMRAAMLAHVTRGRISTGRCGDIAEDLLARLDVASGAEALRRYGLESKARPTRGGEQHFDDATGHPYTVHVFAYETGGDVVLNVGVSPVRTTPRRWRGLRALAGFVDGFRAAPAVRHKTFSAD